MVVCKCLAYFLFRGHRERKHPIINTLEGTGNVSLCHGPNRRVIIYYSEVLLQGLAEFWQLFVYLINLFNCVGQIAFDKKKCGMYQCVNK